MTPTNHESEKETKSQNNITIVTYTNLLYVLNMTSLALGTSFSPLICSASVIIRDEVNYIAVNVK